MLSIGPLAGPTKTLVGQATRDNDSPPSGYQLDLLCKASFASPNECDQLLDAILRRLDSNSANVKWKTLRVIAYLCQHGNASIRKEFQRKIDRIRVCTGFTGTLHPLRGDTPNERVRIAAKDALSALFSTPDSQPHYSNPKISHLSGGESRIPSEEPDGVLGSAFKSVLSSAASLVSNSSSATDHISFYRPSNSSYQITGIGNPSFHRSNSQPSSVLDKMKQVFDPRWKSNSVSQPSGYAGLPMGGGPANRGDFDVKPAMLDGVQQRRPGQVGGNWADDDSEIRLSHSAPVPAPFSEKPSSDMEAYQAHDSDSEYGSPENRFVEELTMPGGVTAAPSSIQLSLFLESLHSLNHALIAELLSRKLDEHNTWQTQTKALSVIETMLNENCEDVAEHFTNLPEHIVKLSSSKLRAVRSKADKVYEMLNLSKVSRTSPVERSASSSQAPALLEFPSSTDATIDLLEMNLTEEASVQASSTSDPLGFLLQQQDLNSERTATSFPFISENPGHFTARASDPSIIPGQSYVPLFDYNASSSKAELSFLDNSFPQQEPQTNSFIVENASKPATNFDFAASSTAVSSFSFVSQPDKRTSSDKPLDPFANAIKTVRKNETSSRDSFSFVQDMINGSATSR